MNTSFVIEKVFDAQIEKVWQALTQPEQMRQWYFSLIQKFEPSIGYEFQFGTDGSPYVKEWKVTDVIPGKKLAHTWSYKGYTGVSEVTFELFKEENKTRLKVTHTGIETFPNDPHFARHHWVSGWERILEQLKILLVKKL